ncbi:phospholipase D-like domain-containing protein [Clostridium sp. DJ247]|uniref:phospholipase D-like domain-containing protein n=1 Tax=Clostridium sp. DJ247 TaxID=2726188 RepID=UPI001627286C|nr:phospholipase D-like domain-containing protein [Clostridium sp. DJ247]MBC2580589.1 hypothetical protein [Clostridium sp. DJ247]
MLEIYFTRPGSKCEIKENIINDIKNTKYRILVCMAYFSDEDFLTAMEESAAYHARFIFNKLDTKYKQRISNLIANKYDIHTVILGDETSYSNMHHKFIILDNIAYVGSYNFTKAATEDNWEYALRIDEPLIVKELEREFTRLWIMGGIDKIRGSKCSLCNSKLTDPLSHYIVTLDEDKFCTVNDPRKYLTAECSRESHTCVSCGKNNAYIILKSGQDKNSYCYDCIGDKLNELYILNQIGWESYNIYYDELGMWCCSNPSEESYICTCDVCGKNEVIYLTQEITRNPKEPYGIKFGEEKNICVNCFIKDFMNAYLLDEFSYMCNLGGKSSSVKLKDIL